MKNKIRLTESDLNRIVKRVIKEDQLETMGNSQTVPAKHFIETLYGIADKYGKVNIDLTYDGKYIVGTETNTRQKFKITIT